MTTTEDKETGLPIVLDIPSTLEDTIQIDNLTASQLSMRYHRMYSKMNEIESDVKELRDDTKELLELVRTARVGFRVLTKFFHGIGVGAVWLAKIFAAVAILWSMMMAWKQVKMPDIKLTLP